jgi:hypothetical protein
MDCGHIDYRVLHSRPPYRSFEITKYSQLSRGWCIESIYEGRFDDEICKSEHEQTLQYNLHNCYNVPLKPFVAYLVFKNKGVLEVTFIHLLQICGYSLAIFVPLGFLRCVLYPLSRLRLILTIAAGMINLYYIQKDKRVCSQVLGRYRWVYILVH